MPGLAARLPLLISESEGPYDLLQTIKQVATQNIKMQQRHTMHWRPGCENRLQDTCLILR